jgi:glycosyltransferase involved in cell wall biosynthesis
LADRIIVNSPWAVEGLKHESIDHSKIEIIPLVHAGEKLPNKRLSRFHFPKRQQVVPSDQNYRPLRVLFLGNICLRKGVGRLIEAMRLLRDSHITLDLYGNPEVDPAFWADLPKVRSHPSVKNLEVRSIFQAADVFILPSISDGFALTQLEALAAGTPVIASRQCGEVVIDGVNGILLQENSPSEIAAILKRLAEDRSILETFNTQILPESLPKSLDDLASRLLGIPLDNLAAKFSLFPEHLGSS